jgi:hypothetical protein
VSPCSFLRRSPSSVLPRWWHPDKLESMAEELKVFATRRTARINEAYEKVRSSRV